MTPEAKPVTREQRREIFRLVLEKTAALDLGTFLLVRAPGGWTVEPGTLDEQLLD